MKFAAHPAPSRGCTMTKFRFWLEEKIMATRARILQPTRSIFLRTPRHMIVPPLMILTAPAANLHDSVSLVMAMLQTETHRYEMYLDSASGDACEFDHRSPRPSNPENIYIDHDYHVSGQSLDCYCPRYDEKDGGENHSVDESRYGDGPHDLDHHKDDSSGYPTENLTDRDRI